MEKARKSSEEQNVDRLSDLPDGVICHILSFLPTQRSVQTSILAKRWRTLWAHVPVIDLQGKDAKTTTFSGIVCTVLLRHKAQTLNTFRLTYRGLTGDQCNAYELETCIATVVERNVQNLFLNLRVELELPLCLLTCKTLVDLPRLLSGCPVLEDLTIIGYPLSSCNISSPTLKRLTMAYVTGVENHPEYLVKITAPALRYLMADDCSNKHISVLPPASLVEAEIFLETSFEFDDLNPRCVLKFLDSFCNVKCLSISIS